MLPLLIALTVLPAARAAPQEVLLQRCRNQNGAACDLLGDLWRTDQLDSWILPDLPSALRAACQSGHAHSCADLSHLESTGAVSGVPDARTGVDLARQACEGDDTEGCARLAMHYQLGIGVAPDPEQASLYAFRACELGDLGVCWNLAEEARARGDLAVSTDLYTRVCASDQPMRVPACGYVGQSLLATGEVERGMGLMDEACRAGHADLCRQLAVIDAKVGGERVVEYLELACAAGQAGSCRDAALRHDEGECTPVDDARAVHLYTAACSGGDAQSCYWLAGMLRRGEGVGADPEAADRLLLGLCGQGFAEVCQEMCAAGHLQACPESPAPEEP